MNARERARLAAEQAAARKARPANLDHDDRCIRGDLVAGGIAFQAWRTSRAPSAAPSVSVSASPVTITNGRPIPLGSAAAPVTITLYEDFHCPHCADFEEQFGSSHYPSQEAGAARLELYPMAFIDEGSLTAANAMACAAEAGLGQAYYLGLFANHTLQWSDPQLIDLATKVTERRLRGLQDVCHKTGACGLGDLDKCGCRYQWRRSNPDHPDQRQGSRYRDTDARVAQDNDQRRSSEIAASTAERSN
jgi:hypothetical protein